MMIVVDRSHSLILTGNGDVIEADDGILAIGSGGNYALAAARALNRTATELSAEAIAEQAMQIAAEICVYTNQSFTSEVLNLKESHDR